MAFQICINLLVALMWMFLGESYSMSGFVTGFIVGIVLLFLLRRFLKGPFYLRRVYKIVSLLLIFIKELILSNFEITKLVYAKRLDINPGIFTMETELETDWEITLLAVLITLTPGTVTLAISPDKKEMYIHAMDIIDMKEAVHSIKDSFEKHIMEVTR
ncbi:Na+/H+ antiporter subunit E [Terribacillus saccharophilus]|uniref:Na+/H+ antiporter subunit E n=1 Tax=Terribacillus saccharophilus TaxID=361277 RepID=A0A268ACN6_9BACI|nr:Na+/H+ antiporter subunit E [Terribacillus saccharophilus]PAD21883.1 Na+/H+ antiporter subunit E [Terribacillus saccharophilus]PAF21919.1 Na+/H+ antiporter subunit E [Terribacillus saccharophilus]